MVIRGYFRDLKESDSKELVRLVDNFFKSGNFQKEPNIRYSIRTKENDGYKEIWMIRERILDSSKNEYKVLSRTYLGKIPY